ncbi:MAG: ATP-binding protein [Hydrogenophaga sp.]|uniref:ATP-binding protein n=1 Tax=Hydrogenophaga sp. TaxID=1904254 RepID=UPI003D9BEEF0
MSDRTRSLVAWVLLFTALAAGVLWWQSTRARAELQAQVLLQAEQRSLHLADAMAGQVEGVFSAVDLALQQLRSEWARGNPAAFAQRAQEALTSLPEGFVSHVVVANAQGQVVYDSLGLGMGVSIADRDYFRAHVAGGDRLAIGVPVRSRLDGRWVFAMSRPVLQGRRFAGTVHLTLGTDAMARRLAGLQLSEQDVVALIHPAGAVLARSRDNTGSMGQRMPGDRPYMVHPETGNGTYRVAGLVDGVPRTYGWHRLPQSGALVVIGLADASVLDPLVPALRRSQWMASALVLLIGLGGVLVAVLLWRVSRSRAEALASEARLKQAQRMARVGNWEHDHTTGRSTWSDEAFRTFGLDPAVDTASHAAFLAAVHPDDRERVEAAFSAAVQHHQTYDVVHRVRLPDGTDRHVHQLGTTTYDGERPLRSLGTVQDITEMRSTQLALQQLNEELEQRVQVRTRELGELNQELESFAYSVAHDLRTPLRTIHGFACLLEEEDTVAQSATGRGHLQRIQEASRRMGQLITDLLTMAQHSRAVVHHERVDLSALARRVAADLEQGQSGPRTLWEIEDGLVVQADPTLMGVVLQNLLGNAWKYTRQTARPRISFTRTAHADGQQAFCVRDNGAGFDMAYAAQLFQPFKRLHGHHEFEGSGVGLASVSRVVRRHGGRVRGEGVVGQGAAFYFSLPDVPLAPGGPMPAVPDPTIG